MIIYDKKNQVIEKYGVIFELTPRENEIISLFTEKKLVTYAEFYNLINFNCYANISLAIYRIKKKIGLNFRCRDKLGYMILDDIEKGDVKL